MSTVGFTIPVTRLDKSAVSFSRSWVSLWSASKLTPDMLNTYNPSLNVTFARHLKYWTVHETSIEKWRNYRISYPWIKDDGQGIMNKEVVLLFHQMKDCNRTKMDKKFTKSFCPCWIFNIQIGFPNAFFRLIHKHKENLELSQGRIFHVVDHIFHLHKTLRNLVIKIIWSKPHLTSKIEIYIKT